MEATITGFEFDIDLDPSLFSLTPLAGQAVTRHTMDRSLRYEQRYLAAWRQSAEINHGVYPDTINALAGSRLAQDDEGQLEHLAEEDRDKQVLRVRGLLAAGFALPLQLSAQTEARYAGKGVHRDDGEQPIFWYQPDGSDKFRIVLAHLTVIEVAKPPAGEDAQEFARERPASVAK